MNKGLSELSDSLLLDAAGGSEGHVPRVRLGLAAVPQIDEGLAHAHHHHGDPRAQAAAVTHHLQQVALLRHLPAHAVQTPVIWNRTVTQLNQQVDGPPTFYIVSFIYISILYCTVSAESLSLFPFTINLYPCDK